jgi:hypothetical protein
MTKINYRKAFNAVTMMDKLPRKTKKVMLGKKMSKSKLKLLLRTVKIIDSSETISDMTIIIPFAFCPHCGCVEMYGSGNLAYYPEHWERFRCFRCKSVVGYIDNSEFVHALECKDDNYNPEFG